MRTRFPQYYSFSEKELSALLKDCVFVFDANVLLNLYRYPRTTREDFLRVLKKLAADKRIWLPFQAALEFQDNRLAVIAEQKRKFTEVRNLLSEINGQLKRKLDDLQLRKRHSSIDPDFLLKGIDKIFKDYLAKLDGLEASQPDVNQNDNIRTEIDKIFSPFVGKGFSKQELEDLQGSKGETRYRFEQPPGYKDAAEKKDSTRFHRDLIIRRKFGDLIIWKEIIAYTKQSKPKGIVFITDDSKDDWWLEVGGKTIGPRPDLVSEFHQETNLLHFHMYNSERFIKVAADALEISIRPQSIEDVKSITTVEIRPISEAQRRRRELQKLYSGKCQVCGFDQAVEAAVIRPLDKEGTPTLSNMLLLCPNHHTLFDLGRFSVDSDFSLIGLDGKLTVVPEHRISAQSLEYHKSNIYVEPPPNE